MNDTNEQRVERLERALLRAGRAMAPVPPGGAWQANVMRAIRQSGPLSAAEAADSVLWCLTWKFAVPAAACALVLCIVVHASGISERYVTQDVELNSTVEYALASVF